MSSMSETICGIVSQAYLALHETMHEVQKF